MGIVAAVVSIGGAIYGSQQQKKAQKKAARAQQEIAASQKEENEITRASDDARESAARSRGIREARIKTAQIINATTAQGFGGSSGSTSVASRLGSSLGAFFGGMSSEGLAQDAIGAQRQKQSDISISANNAIAKIENNAAMVSAFTSMATTGISGAPSGTLTTEFEKLFT